MKSNYIIKLGVLICICQLATSCKKVFDKEDLSAISSEKVWNDVKLTTAYVNTLYLNMPSGIDLAFSSYSDEAGWGNNLSYGKTVAYGRVNPDNNPLNYWAYTNVRNINIFLENIDKGSLEESVKNSLKGQVLFIRAFTYFEMVKRYGGVPIITKPQDLSEDLFVPRNTTTECFTFIESDLTKAIALLPGEASVAGDNLGRITKGAGMSFLGRVKLYKASPQFKPSGDAGLWTQAYTANKEAITYLNANGKGLFNTYGQLWFNEMNKEVIFAIRYKFPERTSEHCACTRPLSETFNCVGTNQPTHQLAEGFPMKNGLPITDPASGYSLNTFWQNRDPRFYDIIVYNGANYPLSGKTNRIQYTYVGMPPYDGFPSAWGTSTGYYSRKAVDLTLTQPEVFNDGVDWVEIRYAEVLMNMAEAANETGQTTEAYDVLKAIRTRAGIDAGSNGLYGLQPGMSKGAMRKAIMDERFIEFALEQKRFWDLRRMRRFDVLDGKKRKGLASVPINPNDLSAGFTYQIKDADLEQAMAFPANYYFFPIPRVELRNNPKLKQNVGWENGDFDPLQ